MLPLRHTNRNVVFIAVVLILLLPPNSYAQYKLKSTVLGAAGQYGTSTSYRLNGTVGQSTPVGSGAASGNNLHAGFWTSAWLAMVTGVEDIPVYRNELFQNYPNPFNPVTTIEYTIEKTGMVELKIYNVLGQRIRTLVRENRIPGHYREVWDGRNEHGVRVATGMYFYRFKVDSYVSTKKMVMLR